MTALAALLLTAAAPARATAGAHVDHVIVGVSDLDVAVRRVEKLTGVRPAIGGSHPGRGTRNALLSLGPNTYLELLAPDPAQEKAAAAADVRELKALTEPMVMGWAVSGADGNALRARAASAGLRLTQWEAGSRNRPDGRKIEWRTFSYRAEDEAAFPFFIAWKDRRLHPARTSPQGCTFRSLSIGVPDAAKLRRALAPLQVNVRVGKSGKRHMALRMVCPKGELVFG